MTPSNDNQAVPEQMAKSYLIVEPHRESATSPKGQEKDSQSFAERAEDQTQSVTNDYYQSSFSFLKVESQHSDNKKAN